MGALEPWPAAAKHSALLALAAHRSRSNPMPAAPLPTISSLGRCPATSTVGGWTCWWAVALLTPVAGPGCRQAASAPQRLCGMSPWSAALHCRHDHHGGGGAAQQPLHRCGLAQAALWLQQQARGCRHRAGAHGAPRCCPSGPAHSACCHSPCCCTPAGTLPPDWGTQGYYWNSSFNATQALETL